MYKSVGARELKVKDRCFLVIDPSNAEVMFQLHWISFNVPNDVVRKALEPYGKATYIALGPLHIEGIQDIESTIRLVWMISKKKARLWTACRISYIYSAKKRCLWCLDAHRSAWAASAPATSDETATF